MGSLYMSSSRNLEVKSLTIYEVNENENLLTVSKYSNGGFLFIIYSNEGCRLKANLCLSLLSLLSIIERIGHKGKIK